MQEFAIKYLLILMVPTVLIGLLIIYAILALRKYVKSSKNELQKKEPEQSFSETLKYYRLQNNMSEEFVADYIGVSKHEIIQWEKGTSFPSEKNLVSLANLYNINPTKLLSLSQINIDNQ